MPNVWYVSKYVAGPAGRAAGSRGYELMREMAQQGVDCTIVTSDSNHHAEDLPRVRTTMTVEKRDHLRICWLRTMKTTKARSVRRIASWFHFEWRLLRMNERRLPRPDVVIVSSLSLFTLLNGFHMRRRFGARLVFEVRDIWPLTLAAEGGFSARNPVIRLLGILERAGYRRADLIVGTMPNLGEHVRSILGRPADVACIPMGFAPRMVSAESDELDISSPDVEREHRIVIGYAGSIGITNALETLLEAARQLRGDDRFRFVVVGDGGLLPDYRRRFGSLPNLTFLGRVPQEKVQDTLQALDVLYLATHPSEVWRYGQSLNKLIDYMLAGKPIIASYTGFPSMLNEADCGTFVPAGDVDSLVEEFRRYLAMGHEKRVEIGVRGRKWLLANRSYATLARQYRNLLFHEDVNESNKTLSCRR